MHANNLVLAGLGDQQKKREDFLKGIPHDTIASLDKVLGVLIANVKGSEKYAGHNTTLNYLENLETLLRRCTAPEDLKAILGALGNPFK